MNRLIKICLVLMVSGVVVSFIGVLLGGKLFFSYTLGGRVKTQESIHMKTEETEPFHDIVIHVESFDVMVVEGDRFQVVWPESNEDMDTECKVENGTLSLVQKYRKQFYIFNFDLISLGKNGINVNTSISGNQLKNNQIVVMVPDKTELNEIKLQSEMGDVTVENLNAEKLNLNLSYGDLELSGVTADSLRCENDCGKVRLENAELGQTIGRLSYGGIIISDSLLGNTDMVLECGDAKISESIGKKLEFDMAYGSFKAEGLLMDSFEAKMECGDVKAKFKNPMEQYAVEIECECGNIKIGGKDEGSHYNYENSAAGDNAVEIENEYGDVRIDFGN